MVQMFQKCRYLCIIIITGHMLGRNLFATNDLAKLVQVLIRVNVTMGINHIDHIRTNIVI